MGQGQLQLRLEEVGKELVQLRPGFRVYWEIVLMTVSSPGLGELRGFCSARVAGREISVCRKFLGESLSGATQPHVDCRNSYSQSLGNCVRVVIESVPQGQYFAVRWCEFLQHRTAVEQTVLAALIRPPGAAAMIAHQLIAQAAGFRFAGTHFSHNLPQDCGPPEATTLVGSKSLRQLPLLPQPQERFLGDVHC